MFIKKGNMFFTILIILFSIFASQVFPQSPEKGIISMPDLSVLLNLLSNVEDAIVKHQWDILFNSLLPPEFTSQYRPNDRWKNLEWVGRILYPDVPLANVNECMQVANSITTIKLFISDIIIYKDPACDFRAEIKGVRIIDFLPGKKYIPVDMFFCKKGNAWLLEVTP